MPIALAMMISLPVAYYFSHQWLKGFVYRIGLNVGLFAFSIAVILIVAVLSIARQTLRRPSQIPQPASNSSKSGSGIRHRGKNNAGAARIF